MYKRLRLLSIAIIISSGIGAQSAYPKSYFRNPLGIPMDLSANFGELRSNHWHMGLDIRTNQKENLAVYAAAQGYISHIGIRPQSFGRFIIITHPNGLSTLYAHLNDFYPELEKYVIDEQYKKESWAIELDITKDQFPVTKGQFIAYSGNTGGSQGPHLHFEIFDTKSEKRLNPLLFDFPLKDNVRPNLVRLAVYDRSRSVYDQTPSFLAVKNTDSGYFLTKSSIYQTGANKISFAIQAYDRLSGSNNPNGIYSAKLIVDGESQISFVLDSIDYEESVFMNAHIDYKFDHNGGAYIQHLSRMPGDKGSVYHPQGKDGIIHLGDTLIHTVSIDVKDAYGNTSVLNFSLQFSDSLAALKKKGLSQLRMLAPNEVHEFEKKDFEMLIGEGCLYDSVPTTYISGNAVDVNSFSASHQFNDPSFPVHNDVLVRIKATKSIPANLEDKLLIQRTLKGSTIRKAVKDGDWYTASFGDFGIYRLVADILPPQINDPGKGDTINLSKSKRIVFSPKDNYGMVKKFRAELNGQWLRFTNDKTRNWIYTFDERCPDGVHFLKVVVEDHAGNITEKSWWFRRVTAPGKK